MSVYDVRSGYRIDWSEGRLLRGRTEAHRGRL